MFADGTEGHYDLIVGADGVSSRTRRTLFQDAPTPTYAGQLSIRCTRRAPHTRRRLVSRPTRTTGFLLCASGARWKLGVVRAEGDTDGWRRVLCLLHALPRFVHRSPGRGAEEACDAGCWAGLPFVRVGPSAEALVQRASHYNRGRRACNHGSHGHGRQHGARGTQLFLANALPPRLPWTMRSAPLWSAGTNERARSLKPASLRQIWRSKSWRAAKRPRVIFQCSTPQSADTAEASRMDFQGSSRDGIKKAVVHMPQRGWFRGKPTPR